MLLGRWPLLAATIPTLRFGIGRAAHTRAPGFGFGIGLSFWLLAAPRCLGEGLSDFCRGREIDRCLPVRGIGEIVRMGACAPCHARRCEVAPALVHSLWISVLLEQVGNGRGVPSTRR